MCTYNSYAVLDDVYMIMYHTNFMNKIFIKFTLFDELMLFKFILENIMTHACNYTIPT